jgi:phospholipid N-methyltransferase
MTKNIVFISWSGNTGKKIAEGLADTIFKDHPELDAWVSSKGIDSGSVWFDEIIKALETAKYAIGCMTPGASIKPWVNFEAGLVFGRLKNFKILKYYEDVKSPLTNLQAIDGTREDELAKMLKEMTATGEKAARAWVQAYFPDFKKVLDELGDTLQPGIIDINASVKSVSDAVTQLKDNDSYRNNACFRQVIAGAISELGAQLNSVRTSFSIPASQYPYHLISLQSNRKLNPVVKAVALVDQQERFWQDVAGREILETAHEKNQRVFVFITPEDFTKNFDTLRNHAQKYDVWAMSFESLTRECYPYNKDFSIIETADSKLLATYDKTRPMVTISFLTDEDEIVRHKAAFKKISRFAKKIEQNSQDTMESLRRRVFDRPLTELRRVSVEMSDYISVDEYDLHEEEHAYYKEMMQRMIEIFSAHRGSPDKERRVLELGAGTGLFTKRLASQPNVKVGAVEVDWACFKRLLQNAQDNYENVKFYPDDSRTFYDDEQYEYIFSAFADHHIKFEDKETYLENVKQNLEAGGLFIVGDEFLPPYDRETRRQALETYHRHIINIAEEQGNYTLVKLEEAALKSGLEERGDFKLSCEEYEKLLREVGFQFKSEKIGPKKLDDVGGVYVYTVWLPKLKNSK